jgi:Ser/Thr protein kinase RdoA (MazF antagonist)
MPMDEAYEALREENDALHSELYRIRKKLLECELQRDYLRRELDALRESNRNWISTNERLPTEDGKYIVAYKANRGGWKVKSVYYRDGKWIGVAYDVTHWRECPAPPEME